MNFENLSEIWLCEKSKSVKESTFYLYDYCLKKYFIPKIGELSVKKLTCEKICSVFESFSEGNSVLKVSTRKNLLMILRQILKFAVREKLLKPIFLEMKFDKKKSGHKIEVFDLSEQKFMMSKLSDETDPMGLGVILSLSLGIRIGEACALRWKDVDFERGVLSVNGTVQRIGSKVVRGSPKSAKSERAVPIPDEILPMLKMRKITGNSDGEEFIVTKNGKMTEPRALRRFFAGFCKKNKIRGLKFHSLRHTFATRCLESGVDCKTVSEILGHADISTTLNLYAHPSMEAKRKCVNLVKLL